MSDTPHHKIRRERATARPASKRDGRARDDDRAAARVERLAQQSWVEGAEPELPVRTTRPENVVFHLGPTNSGKTYESLLALRTNGRGVYAAPLRQLAHEAYARLSAELPPGTVGLSTGEEEIDPDAPIVCCTVEKAPDARRPAGARRVALGRRPRPRPPLGAAACSPASTARCT